MGNAGASSTLRLVRRLWPRRSELMRRTDWVEAALLVTVLTVGLVLLPVALMLGSETYATKAALADEQAGTRHQSTATLMVDAPPTADGGRGEIVSTSTSAVQARWQAPDGSIRVGPVDAARGLRAGSGVPVWLDPAGNPVDRPLTEADAGAAGFTVATVTWTAVVTLLAGLFFTARAGLNRARLAAWQREWARVEPEWNHRRA